MKLTRIALVGWMASILCWPPHLTGQGSLSPAKKDKTGKETPKKKQAKSENPPNEGLIRTTISTSRHEVSGNAGYGVFAELENIGTVPVTLYSNETVLV